MCGAENPFASSKVPYQLAEEAVLAADPQVILPLSMAVICNTG